MVSPADNPPVYAQMAANTSLVLLAALIEALWLLLVSWGERGARVVESILLLLIMGAVYCVALYVIRDGLFRPSNLIIIAAAFLFRFTAFLCPAPFSDDVFRYRWEGKVQAGGENPYELAPDDAAAAPFRDEAHERIPARNLRAGYGPLLEAVYGGWYRVHPQADAWRWKIPAAAADALLIALLAAKTTPATVLAYAWLPLTAWEFWGNGHNDAFVALLVTAALLAATPRAMYIFLGLATAAKLWPALLYPLFLRRRPSFTAALVVPIFLLLALPYWTDPTINIRQTSGFLGGWRNNDSLFTVIAAAAPDAVTAKWIAAAIAATWACVAGLRSAQLFEGARAIVTGLLLISANVHPWYLTWLAPLLGRSPPAGLVLWCCAIPLSYGALLHWNALGEWEGVSAMRWWVYAPVLALLAAEWLRSHRRKE